jgi:hypothetical protein
MIILLEMSCFDLEVVSLFDMPLKLAYLLILLLAVLFQFYALLF